MKRSSGPNRPGSSVLVVLVFGLLTLGGCSSIGTAPNAQVVLPPETSASTAEDRPDSQSWAQNARSLVDERLAEAETHIESGDLAEAQVCVDDALATLLGAPSEIAGDVAYLDYLREVFEIVARLEDFSSNESPAAPTVELAQGISEAEIEEAAVEPEPEEAPFLPPSDYPLRRNSVVEAFIDGFQNKEHLRKQLTAGLDRGGVYIDKIENQLEAAGLPRDLAYLPLIESAFSNVARSRASASGMWQFMAGTAREYHLEVGWLVDERYDFEASTGAAIAFLGDLYAEFGDWNLALAGYNAGPGRVRRAIRRSGQRDYWRLRAHLPRETRNYVPAFMAAIIISKHPDAYGFEPIDRQPLVFETIEVDGMLDLEVLASALEVDGKGLRDLNPGLRRGLTRARSETSIRVPLGQAGPAARFLEATPRKQWAPTLIYQVTRGDTLSKIASRNGSTVSAIRDANGLRGSLIHPGQQLVVPRTVGTPSSVKSRTTVSAGGTYVVRRRDTLSAIATRHSVSLNALLATNGLNKRSVIHPGQRLQIPEGRAASSQSGSYRVRRGDTLSAIARRFGTTVDTLRQINRIRGTLIRPGDLLRIPG